MNYILTLILLDFLFASLYAKLSGLIVYQTQLFNLCPTMVMLMMFSTAHPSLYKRDRGWSEDDFILFVGNLIPLIEYRLSFVSSACSLVKTELKLKLS